MIRILSAAPLPVPKISGLSCANKLNVLVDPLLPKNPTFAPALLTHLTGLKSVAVKDLKVAINPDPDSTVSFSVGDVVPIPTFPPSIAIISTPDSLNFINPLASKYISAPELFAFNLKSAPELTNNGVVVFSKYATVPEFLICIYSPLACDSLIPPLELSTTSNFVAGAVVPIPTFPDVLILIVSTPAFINLICLLATVSIVKPSESAFILP